MAAVALDAGFAMYLSKPAQKFIIDLSSATVVDVLSEYQLFRRKQSPQFTISSLIYNIGNVETNYGITLMPLHVTDDFYVHFISYLLQAGCCPSTIATYCSQLKAAFSWGTRHNLQVSPSYDKFEIGEYHRTQVALSADEVSMIYHYDIDHNFEYTPTGRRTRSDHLQNLHRVRDMFVLSCNLGQRHSDMRRIAPSCFSEDRQTFRIRQQKTNNEAVVHIPTYSFDKRMVSTILKRYDYHAPYTATINNYNDYLHELVERIGFKEMVKSENKVRGEMEVLEAPKWKLISSHTARRTFATYNVKRDISEAKIRRCTGHADSRSFCQYIIWGDD